MIDKPMLFSGAMVTAIRDGRKTQSRRIVKPQPPFGCSYVINGAFSHALCFQTEYPPDSGEAVWVAPTAKSKDHRLPCPHPVGSRIWVKETFSPWKQYPPSTETGVWYRADNGDIHQVGKWTPSIFMPRAYSRIDLEVTAVRVERLNEISGTDANSEGCQVGGTAFDSPDIINEEMYQRALHFAYKDLWESINGKSSWGSNPFVWVYEFRRIK